MKLNDTYHHKSTLTNRVSINDHYYGRSGPVLIGYFSIAIKVYSFIKKSVATFGSILINPKFVAKYDTVIRLS